MRNGDLLADMYCKRNQKNWFACAFGFTHRCPVTLISNANLDSAKTSLIAGDGQKFGTGMDKGKITVRSRSNFVRIALRTPHNRSGDSPVFEGKLVSMGDAGTQMKGEFRITYPQTFALAMIAIGILISSVEFILGREYRHFDISFATACISAALLTLLAFLIPHIGWKTRAWKRHAIIDYAKSCGFKEATQA